MAVFGLFFAKQAENGRATTCLRLFQLLSWRGEVVVLLKILLANNTFGCSAWRVF